MDKMYHFEQLKVRFIRFINFIYFIIDNKTRDIAIIDPAWNIFRVESMLKRINGHLKLILLTHSHFDHINLVNPLLKKYNPQVFMSSKEINFYNFRCRNLNPIECDGQIQLGDTEITSIMTPGHTIGSVCFQLSDHLFTGDTIFIEGCGLCDSYSGNPAKLFESIHKIKKMVHPDIEIYPSHSFGKKPGYKFNHLLRENIYFQIDDEELFIKFRMRKNQKGLFNFK